MNPISFLFQLLSEHLQFTEEDAAAVQQKAADSYEGSKIKAFFDKYWWLALVLPVLLPVLKSWLDKALASIMPDMDGDGDHDIADLLTLAAEKLRGQKSKQ